MSRGSSQESLRSIDSHDTSSITSVDSLERNIQQIIEETCIETSDVPNKCDIHTAFPVAITSNITVEFDSNSTTEQAVEFLLKKLKANNISNAQVPRLQDCYLVAVIGNRERILRDGFLIRQLQKPWTNGRLYVRLRRDTLAALEMEQSLVSQSTA